MASDMTTGVFYVSPLAQNDNTTSASNMTGVVDMSHSAEEKGNTIRLAGDVYARWSTNGLSGARFFMRSTEDFSLDRETVETLLTTSAIPDRWGMRWIRNRINKKMVGTEAQRPFDSANVELTLQERDGVSDQLLGPITLKSETLDLNIEWAVDVDAIYAAMESDLTAVENVSTGAVQSDNQ